MINECSSINLDLMPTDSHRCNRMSNGKKSAEICRPFLRRHGAQGTRDMSTCSRPLAFVRMQVYKTPLHSFVCCEACTACPHNFPVVWRKNENPLATGKSYICGLDSQRVWSRLSLAVDKVTM